MNPSTDSFIDHHPRSLPATELVLNQIVDASDPSYASIAKTKIWHSLWRFSQIPNFKNLYNFDSEEFAGVSLYSRCAEITATMGPANDISFASLKVLPSGDVLIRFKDFLSWFIFDKDLPHFLSFHYQDPFTNRDQIVEVPVGYFNKPIQIMRVDVNHPSLSIRPRDIADYIVRELKFSKGNYVVRYRLLDGIWTGQFCLYFNTQRDFSQLFPTKAVNFSPPNAPPLVAQVEEFHYPTPPWRGDFPTRASATPPSRGDFPPLASVSTRRSSNAATQPSPDTIQRAGLAKPARVTAMRSSVRSPAAAPRIALLPTPKPISTNNIIVSSVDLSNVNLGAERVSDPKPVSASIPKRRSRNTNKVIAPSNSTTNSAPPPMSETQEEELLSCAMDIAASNEEWSLVSRRPLPFLRRSLRASGGRPAKLRVHVPSALNDPISNKLAWASAQAKQKRKRGPSKVKHTFNKLAQFTFNLTNDPPPSSSPAEAAHFLDGILADANRSEETPARCSPSPPAATNSSPSTSPPRSPPRASNAAHPHSNVGVIAGLFGSVVPRLRKR